MFSNRKLLLYGIVLGAMLLGRLGAPQLNVLVGSGMAAWIIFNKRLDLLPLLILANLPITAFNINYSIYGSYEGMVETYKNAYINIAGLPISAGLVSVVSMAAVCGLNFLNNAPKYYPGVQGAMFFLWIIGAGVSVLIALSGVIQGHQAWSGPLRGYLSLIGIFYGYGLALDRPHLKTVLFKDLLIFALIIGILAIPRMFYHRLMFFGASFFPALAIAALRMKGPGSKILGLGNLIVWGIYAVFVGNTLSLFMLYAISVFLGGIMFLRVSWLKGLVGRCCGGIMVVTIIVYMFVAIIGAKYLTMGAYGQSGADLTLQERIIFKVFDDRARLWGYVIDDIKRDNLFMPIPGEDMLVIHPKFGEVYVRHGAHNSFLQAVRENGIIAGSIIVILMGFALVATAKAYRGSVGGYTAALAAGAIPTLTVGAVTGHYVIGQTIGAFIFLFAGMAMARDASPVGMRPHRHGGRR